MCHWLLMVESNCEKIYGWKNDLMPNGQLKVDGLFHFSCFVACTCFYCVFRALVFVYLPKILQSLLSVPLWQAEKQAAYLKTRTRKKFAPSSLLADAFQLGSYFNQSEILMNEMDHNTQYIQDLQKKIPIKLHVNNLVNSCWSIIKFSPERKVP